MRRFWLKKRYYSVKNLGVPGFCLGIRILSFSTVVLLLGEGGIRLMH